MKWKVKLVSESDAGERTEEEIATVEREDLLTPAAAGLTIAEGKVIMEGLQKRMVAAQVEHHGASIQSCVKCGTGFRIKGYYNATLRTVYGNVPMRVRRLRKCPCTGEPGSWSMLCTNKTSGHPRAAIPDLENGCVTAFRQGGGVPLGVAAAVCRNDRQHGA